MDPVVGKLLKHPPTAEFKVQVPQHENSLGIGDMECFMEPDDIGMDSEVLVSSLNVRLSNNLWIM